jgi:hypothetical protein
MKSGKPLASCFWSVQGRCLAISRETSSGTRGIAARKLNYEVDVTD